MISAAETDAQRAANLLDAQRKAEALFEEIGETLVRPGVSEKELSDEIHKLAVERYAVKTHWHKRVIRSGPNTMLPYAENPPDRVIEEDDILFVDLGPVFEEWEADFGRTFVLGNDPAKIRLRDALGPVWRTVRDKYHENPDTSGDALYAFACEQAKLAGFEFGGRHSGHLVGQFPHERIPKDKVELYITTGSDKPMSRLDPSGQKRHWILEIFLIDRALQRGAFCEQLLTIG